MHDIPQSYSKKKNGLNVSTVGWVGKEELTWDIMHQQGGRCASVALNFYDWKLKLLNTWQTVSRINRLILSWKKCNRNLQSRGKNINDFNKKKMKIAETDFHKCTVNC